MAYFCSSDWHFGHKRMIRSGERVFESIADHDAFIFETVRRWFETDDALGHVPGPADTFYFLGDLGEAPWRIEREMRLLFERTSLKKVAVLGNHDHTDQRKLIARLFDEVYAFPVYISDTVVLSHYPVAVYDSQVNVHGHLHGSRLRDPNHLNASIAVAGYEPLTQAQVEGVLAGLPTWSGAFLHEPYAADYLFVDGTPRDVVVHDDGSIDLAASLRMREESAQGDMAQGDAAQGDAPQGE